MRSYDGLCHAQAATGRFIPVSPGDVRAYSCDVWV